MKHRVFILTFSVLTLAACGRTGSTAYIHEALTTDSQSPWAGEFDLQKGEIQFPIRDGRAERLAIVRYPQTSTARRGVTTCLVDIAPERDAALRNEILASLSKSWRKVFEPKKGATEIDLPSDRDFRFDLTSQVVINGPGSFNIKQESLQYRRLCLSREMVRSDGYNGMRILELESAVDEKITYMAFRFKKRSDDPSRNLLLITDRKTERYGQLARNLESVESVFAPIEDGKLGIPVGVYIEN